MQYAQKVFDHFFYTLWLYWQSNKNRPLSYLLYSRYNEISFLLSFYILSPVTSHLHACQQHCKGPSIKYVRQNLGLFESCKKCRKFCCRKRCVFPQVGHSILDSLGWNFVVLDTLYFIRNCIAPFYAFLCKNQYQSIQL